MCCVTSRRKISNSLFVQSLVRIDAAEIFEAYANYICYIAFVYRSLFSVYVYIVRYKQKKRISCTFIQKPQKNYITFEQRWIHMINLPDHQKPNKRNYKYDLVYSSLNLNITMNCCWYLTIIM